MPLKPGTRVQGRSGGQWIGVVLKSIGHCEYKIKHEHPDRTGCWVAHERDLIVLAPPVKKTSIERVDVVHKAGVLKTSTEVKESGGSR